MAILLIVPNLEIARPDHSVELGLKSLQRAQENMTTATNSSLYSAQLVALETLVDVFRTTVPTVVEITLKHPSVKASTPSDTEVKRPETAILSNCWDQYYRGSDDVQVCTLTSTTASGVTTEGPALVITPDASKSEADIAKLGWAHVGHRIDLTPSVLPTAWFSMALTLFVTFVFIAASYFFTRDANNLVVEPVERMNDIASSLNNTLFGQQAADSKEQLEIQRLEQMISNMAHLFEVGKEDV